MSSTSAPHLLSRSARRDRANSHDGQPLLGEIRLARARVHEFCGPSRRTLALVLAGKMTDPVVWIQPSWASETLNADGMHSFVDPARLVFVSPKRADDILWVMEEALRSGSVRLVVGDLPEPPGLTPVRRLHLAAEAGTQQSGIAPLGLLLTPGEGGVQGVESRWEMVSAHTGGAMASQGWQLHRRRARAEPLKTWAVTRGPSGLALGP